MRRVLDRVVVTTQPVGRIFAWAKHRRARVRKKYGEAFIMAHADRLRPQGVIEDVRHLAEFGGLRLGDRAQRRLCNVLRRSGQRIVYVPWRTMEARQRAGLDPYTGAPQSRA